MRCTVKSSHGYDVLGSNAWKASGFLFPVVMSAGGKVVVGRVWVEKNGAAPCRGPVGILQHAWLQDGVLFFVSFNLAV